MDSEGVILRKHTFKLLALGVPRCPECGHEDMRYTRDTDSYSCWKCGETVFCEGYLPYQYSLEELRDQVGHDNVGTLVRPRPWGDSEVELRRLLAEFTLPPRATPVTIRTEAARRLMLDLPYCDEAVIAKMTRRILGER